jgi:hypothetical protein
LPPRLQGQERRAHMLCYAMLCYAQVTRPRCRWACRAR